MDKIVKFFKNKEYNKTVDPVFGWGIYGGVLGLSVILALIFWL